MKKILCLMLSVMMVLSSFVCTTAFAEDDIKIIINGKNLTMDQAPVIVNDRTLVPLRAIFEGLGASVEWDDSTKTATGVKEGKEIKIAINSTTAYVDGQAVTLDVPAQLINSRTLVPVRFISESLGETVEWDSSTKTVTITSSASVLYEENFDSKESVVLNTDFICGGAYAPSKVSLSKDFDHTTGSGKSVKMQDRTKMDDRVKFKNAFDSAVMGETYKISAYVYAPNGANAVRLGVFGDTGTPVAINPPAQVTKTIPANEWMLLEFNYTYADELITQVGVEQVSKEFAEVLYIDDVKVEKAKTEETVKETGLDDIKLEYREGKRPTPVITNTGKTYDDLIFYDRVFEEAEKQILSSEEMFASLPKNPRVVADNNVMLASKLTGEEYSTVEKIKVEDMPFTEAIRATVTTVPEKYPYATQLTLPSLGDDDFEEGDNMLAIFYMRTIKAGNEMALGQVQLIVEQEVAPNDKSLKEDVKTMEGVGWKKVYLPFVGREGYTRLCIRLGYYVQTVEFGGYQILNYGKDVDFEDLPSDTIMTYYDKKDLFEKDVDWRKDAWDRIEQIRKGDINVIVKDENGNIIPDADVKIDMYDHEFLWGSAINSNILGTNDFAEQYRLAVSSLFNGAVSEVSHKWNELEKDPQKAINEMAKAKELGLKYYRGHTLLLDRDYMIDENGNYTDNTTIPEHFARTILTGDKAKIDKAIEDHMNTHAGMFSGQLCDWDVVNEILNNNSLRTKYGNEVLKEWFAWAQAADSTAKMYINETGITGVKENGREYEFNKIITDMVERGVDFDGIGIQGHFGAFVSPESFYDEMMSLAKHGKEMKITEFDCTLDMHNQDEEAEASFTRDILILVFSIENFNGFLMWGFTDRSHWLKNAAVFDENMNLKMTGEQYLDLVYNKWWTQEEGKTGSNGTYSTRGYYGDYLITATKDGKSATYDVKCYKGNNNTIEIVLK